jgi:hypothetical protein
MDSGTTQRREVHLSTWLLPQSLPIDRHTGCDIRIRLYNAQPCAEGIHTRTCSLSKLLHSTIALTRYAKSGDYATTTAISLMTANWP